MNEVEKVEKDYKGYVIRGNGENWEVVANGEIFDDFEKVVKYIDNGLRKTTAEQRKKVYNYDDVFERVNCRFAKGTKERIKKVGYKSINDFIKLAVAEKLEHDEKILK